MKYWIIILWIPVGNLYLFWYKYMYIGGVTVKELFTDRQYKLLIIDSGIFGLLTPWLNHIYRHKHRKPEMRQVKPAPVEQKQLKYELQS